MHYSKNLMQVSAIFEIKESAIIVRFGHIPRFLGLEYKFEKKF